MTELRKTTNIDKRKILLQIIPEQQWLRDESLKDLKGSTRGGWSIWIRETLCGIPFEYNDYLETAIHEVAHAITFQKLRTHTHSDRIFKQNLNRLRNKAKNNGVWPKKRVPKDLTDLFESYGSTA